MEDENISKVIPVAQVCEYVKIIKFYNLNEWIWWYVNYIPMEM